MKTSLLARLDQISDRQEELGALLGDASVIADQGRFRAYSREFSEIEPVVTAYRQYLRVCADLEDAQAMLEEDDPELREMAEDEIQGRSAERDALEDELRKLLLPKDPDDVRNVFLEIRAGTGGDEAAIFAGDLHRMYLRYAEQRGWRAEVISASDGEHGGYREIITRIVGDQVYGSLKFESGAHRVQRVPETESQGRIHTSACTVAVMSEVDDVEEANIDRGDLRIDTFRASGAGGQHVNKTDSAIRITHLPSGIVVECQDERSQHKNRARAMALLQARLHQQAQDTQAREQAEQRRLLVGSGDRSERIRTYNFPQGRVTDHRINLTLYRLSEIMEGDLAPVVDALLQEQQAELLASMGD